MALRVGAFPCNGLILRGGESNPCLRFPLEGQRITIGRTPDNDVVVPHPYVSGHHLALDCTPDGWTFVDNHSRSGAYLNGQRASSARLHVGDAVYFGGCVLHFEHHATEGSVTEPPTDDELAVWADALCDRGDPRGDFVNYQLAAQRLPASDPRRLGLLAHAELLLERHERSWVGPLPVPIENWCFRHGRLAAVRVAADVFLDIPRMRALLETRAPRCVAFLPRSLDAERLQAVAQSPLLDSLADVELPPGVAHEPLRRRFAGSEPGYFSTQYLSRR
jgi:FHA domain-containing protein